MKTTENPMSTKETLLKILDSIDTGEILSLVTRGDCTTLTDAVDEICQYRIPREIVTESNSYAYPQSSDVETAQAVIDRIRWQVQEYGFYDEEDFD